jgi:hypothetical protein
MRAVRRMAERKPERSQNGLREIYMGTWFGARKRVAGYVLNH